MTTELPPGYVPPERAREALPDPEPVRVSGDVTLETLHVSGPDPTLVFVHGGLGSLWDPYPQLHALRGDRRLVTYSLAGNRNSSDRPAHTLDGHVTDLENLLDELGVEQPVVHGHSYGTNVAIEYAQRNPVSGLVVASGGDHDLSAAFEPQVLAAVRTLRLYRLPKPTPLVGRLVSAAACHPETPRSVATDFAEANPIPDRRSAYAVQRAFHGYDGRDDHDRIDAPTLVVHGAADDVVSKAVGEGTADRIPGAVFHCLDGAGHLPFIERPAAYEHLLRALFDAVEGGQTLDSAVSERVGASGDSPADVE